MAKKTIKKKTTVTEKPNPPKTFIRSRPFEVRVRLEVGIPVDAPDPAGALELARKKALGEFMTPNNSTVIKK